MGDSVATRRIGGRKWWWLVPLASLLAIGSDPNAGSVLMGPPPQSLADARLAPLRAAAVKWARRTEPERRVIDQVCLVPDLATFCATLAHWDRDHFFPILIEDAESTARFLRAFHPARVVRVPLSTAPIAPGQTWAVACASVRAAWRAAGTAPEGTTSALDEVPAPALGSTPPGVVLTNPDSAMLAGALALAAGRFQPLARLDASQGYAEVLGKDEFAAFNQQVNAAVARVAPRYGELGDDCDFLTVAGNFPYRYRDASGAIESVDDGLGRDGGHARWAYAGRLLGNSAQSVYQAMCALFLQPESALLIDGYDDSTLPWSDYSTDGAATRLAPLLSVANFAGRQSGTVAGWFEAFDPANRSGLIWINSHGSPTVFHLQNAEVSTADLPRTVPCVVAMIHSFSAADPSNPATLAGRWLANGAFIYFGSINEPFLQAFRTPRLAADLIAEHLPLAAALRNTAVEPYGDPWRLEYLGDPLYRLKPRSSGAPAPARASAVDFAPLGPILAGSASPQDDTPAAAYQAALDNAFVLAATPGLEAYDPALGAAINRLEDLDRLPLSPPQRQDADLVLADLLFNSHRRTELRTRIESIPAAERSPGLVRWLDAIRSSEFAWLLSGDDFTRIVAAWSRLSRAEEKTADWLRQATGRVGALAQTAERRTEWAEALRAAIRARPFRADVDLRAELQRIGQARQTGQSPPAP